MKAERYLNQLTRLEVLINNKLVEQQRVFDLAMRITPNLSGLPSSSGVSDKVGNAASRLADLEREIDACVDRLIDTRKNIIRLLEMLPPDEYNVLHQYYLQGQTVEMIAAHWSPRECSPRTIYKIKANGLRRVQNLLDGRRQMIQK